jgi:hypothetical protein
MSQAAPQQHMPLAILLVTLAVAGFVYKVFSSLVLHPLAKIPGPKYAAITHYYQFYYDVLKRGRFPWELRRLHQVYGTMNYSSYKCLQADKRRSSGQNWAQ